MSKILLIKPKVIKFIIYNTFLYIESIKFKKPKPFPSHMP